MLRLRVLFMFTAFFLFGQAVSAQNRTLQGLITSAEDGEPLIGAVVAVKGNETQGTITDINGHYTLEITSDASVLIVSYVGMKTQEVRIPSSRNKVNIILQPDTQVLQEIVVTGYGNFTKSSFTGSANTIRADMMKDVPVMNVEQKLEGMTTGVNITGSSGQPGANQSIRIRGMGSFNASQESLFVIDGLQIHGSGECIRWYHRRRS